MKPIHEVAYRRGKPVFSLRCIQKSLKIINNNTICKYNRNTFFSNTMRARKIKDSKNINI